MCAPNEPVTPVSTTLGQYRSSKIDQRIHTTTYPLGLGAEPGTCFLNSGCFVIIVAIVSISSSSSVLELD